MPPLVETVQAATRGSAQRREKLAEELPTIPGYEILGVLGRGGMGVVYKARQINLNRLVALKMMPAGAHASPHLLARFHVEAEAVASLQHPNIVQIYEVGAHGQCPYFSLEFMDGGSLEEKFGAKPQPARLAAELVETLARAMHCAHQRGVIHRDLKPANILLASAVRSPWSVAGDHGLRTTDCGLIPKITDFGLAKRLEDTSQTQTGAILGTPSYMAPEQAAGHIRAIGPATDVYALGAILYELLTGRPPFHGKSIMETIQQVQFQEPLPLARWRVKVPHDLEIICFKCLEKEPRKRYASAEALADDLHRFLTAEPIHARPVGSWERAAKWARRRPALAALLGVSALFLLSLLGVSLSYNARLQTALMTAEANFQRARRAVDKVLTVMAEEHLADKPHMEEKQKELLADALTIYKEFLSEKSNDPIVQDDTALAHNRMGDILRVLGKNDLAEEAYGQAIRLLGPLAQSAPTISKYRDHLAHSFNYLGEALRMAGHREEAKEAYVQALELLQELALQYPEAPAYQQKLSRTVYNLGILSADSSPKEAEKLYHQAIATLEKLANQFPDVPAYHQDLARSYLNLGAVLCTTKCFQEAKEANDKAIALLENLVKKYPANREYRLELAVSCNNLGNSLTAIGEYGQAEAVLRKAVRALEELTRDFPRVPSFRRQLASAYNGLGFLLDRTFRWPAAKDAWLAARSIYQQLVLEYPVDLDYQAELGRVHGNLGWLCYHPLRLERELAGFFDLHQADASAPLGRVLRRLAWLEFQRSELAAARRHLEDGTRYLELALKSNPAKPDYLDALRKQYEILASTVDKLALSGNAGHTAEASYRVAGYLARLVALLEMDTQLAEAERKRRVKMYTDAALASLKEAIRSGYTDIDHLRHDPALEPLRRREDFAKLLRVKDPAARR